MPVVVRVVSAVLGYRLRQINTDKYHSMVRNGKRLRRTGFEPVFHAWQGRLSFYWTTAANQRGDTAGVPVQGTSPAGVSSEPDGLLNPTPLSRVRVMGRYYLLQPETFPRA